MMHRCTPNYDDHRHAGPRRLTKLLISVTVQGRVGSVQLIMSPENTVGHLIKAVLEVFEKERRRPLLNENHPSCFELHYSPFSLQRASTSGTFGGGFGQLNSERFRRK
ncbi:uncharacterized protein [Spinacia oleracea]|uniref:Uncharacterized protein isoform X2 n=1 Tax=Spinacia oleracea TaxID=3562 RepID=A0ABM3R111_SPIOL|nr:uncharacterized protein LOC130464011 isoform X2 [Spinacia oleracea]